MRFVAALLFLLLSSSAYAQDIPSPDADIEDIPPGEDQIIPLKEGEEAPFDGQLFSPATALRWANWLRQYKYKLEWDVNLVSDVCRANLDYKEELLEIEKKKGDDIQRDLEDRLSRSEQARLAAEEEARNPPWYRTWEFGVGVGVVSTVALIAVTAVALNAAQK